MDSISIASVTIDTYQTGKNNRLSAFSFPCDSLFPPFYRLLYFGKFKTTNPYLTSSSCPPLMIQQWGISHISNDGSQMSLPISCTNIFIINALDNDPGTDRLSAAVYGNNTFKLWAHGSDGSFVSGNIQWMVICR